MLKKKSLNWLIWLFIFGFGVFVAAEQFVLAISSDKPVSAVAAKASSDSETPAADAKLPSIDDDSAIKNTESVANTNDADNILPDILNKSPKKIRLVIDIVVPHNIRAVDWCRIYPYPVAPPIKKNEITEIPYKDKQLRSALLAMGYWGRTRPDKIYPAGGWRMQYALKAAVAKSGLGMPHTLFTEYVWVENITPYMRKETVLINAKEKERKNRYAQMQQVFIDYRAEIETQALNKGLFPIDYPMKAAVGGYRRGESLVDKATWWIVAMHKVAGLKYYWLYPVKLSDSPQQEVTLNEDNAIFIEGAW